ncbi:MAG TPA: hypothetical protein VF732_06460, partial [Nitrospira sp.]
MLQTAVQGDTGRYSQCIEASKRIRWDIDKDVIRGRQFDFSKNFLPDGLSNVHQLDFLSEDEQRLISQIQGRTYANMFGLVERFINAKILEVSREHWLSDQTALEALVHFSDEELKHQELFRRIDRLIADGMPPGYSFLAQPNDVASFVLSKSTWAVLALACHIELVTLAHYKHSIEPNNHLSALYKDVFLYHWQEESQHAILDELEWSRENEKLTAEQRDHAVDDLIELVGAVDRVLQAQAEADTQYFLSICGRSFSPEAADKIKTVVFQAYRWQFIISGVKQPRFVELLGGMITEAQGHRIDEALAPF